MNKNIVVAIIVIVLVVGGVALLMQTKTPSTSNETTNPPPPPAGNLGKGFVKLRTDPVLGDVLTDINGMSLYYDVKEKKGVSNCYDACEKVWLPYHNSKFAVIRQYNDPLHNALSTFYRKDGSLQFAYGPNMLYYYSEDKKPGDTKGAGANSGEWQLVVVHPK